MVDPGFPRWGSKTSFSVKTYYSLLAFLGVLSQGKLLIEWVLSYVEVSLKSSMWDHVSITFLIYVLFLRTTQKLAMSQDIWRKLHEYETNWAEGGGFAPQAPSLGYASMFLYLSLFPYLAVYLSMFLSVCQYGHSNCDPQVKPVDRILISRWEASELHHQVIMLRTGLVD